MGSFVAIEGRAAWDDCAQTLPKAAVERLGGLGFEVCLLRLLQSCIGGRQVRASRSLDVDLEPIDLLDQDHDRLSRGPKLCASVRREASAPPSQDLDTRFVKPLVHLDAQSTTPPYRPCNSARGDDVHVRDPARRRLSAERLGGRRGNLSVDTPEDLGTPPLYRSTSRPSSYRA